MKKLLVLVTLMLAACSPQVEEVQLVKGVAGNDGSNGRDGYTTLIDTQSVLPGELCQNGGIKMVPYTDYNRNSLLDVAESNPLLSATICNGTNGLNGQTGATGAQGIQGNTGVMGPIGPQGVQGIAGIPGVQGIAGPQGAQGLQGIQGVAGQTGATGAQGQQGVIGATGPQGQPGVQGIAGTNGSGGLTPIKLCANDNSAFPEYGFVVDNSLYAVYYGVINGTLNAFMARLNPGNYMSTNSTNCTFTYANDGTNQYLNGVLIPKSNNSGLLCQVYDSRSIDRSSGIATILTNSTPKFELVINQLDVGDTQASGGFPKFNAAQSALVGTEDYALDCAGYLNVPKSQTYRFDLLSDDGVKFYINNNILISMDQLQAPTNGSANAYLLKGLNKINVLYFQGPLSQIALKLNWSAPEFSSVVVPSTALSH